MIRSWEEPFPRTSQRQENARVGLLYSDRTRSVTTVPPLQVIGFPSVTEKGCLMLLITVRTF